MPKRQGESMGGTAIGRSVLDMAAREGLSVRATYERVLPTQGGNMVKGDPVQVADKMEDWYSSKACDGFMLSMPVELRSLRDFVELVVPELQRRGLVRAGIADDAAREHGPAASGGPVPAGRRGRLRFRPRRGAAAAFARWRHRSRDRRGPRG